MAFEEKGWRGATVEAIAERAGLTRGALHHHFRDKTTLLREALTWGWSMYAGRLFASDPGTDPVTELSSLLTEYARLLSTDPLFRALASTTTLVAPQAFDDVSEKAGGLDDWHTRIAALLATDPAEAGTVAPAHAASLVLVVLQGLTVTAMTRPQDLPQPQHREASMKALARGLLS